MEAKNVQNAVNDVLNKIWDDSVVAVQRAEGEFRNVTGRLVEKGKITQGDDPEKPARVIARVVESLRSSSRSFDVIGRIADNDDARGPGQLIRAADPNSDQLAHSVAVEVHEDGIGSCPCGGRDDNGHRSQQQRCA